jgi:hypothetical protein
LSDGLPFQRIWPTSLAEAMRCLKCGAQVDWRSHRDVRTGRFICPMCTAERPSHNASKSLREKVGERDGWTCHRCRFPIDPALGWPHPLAPVADHHPVPRAHGGPTILANLKIAHSLCNGNTASARYASWQSYPSHQRQLLEAIVRLPVDDKGHVQDGTAQAL